MTSDRLDAFFDAWRADIESTPFPDVTTPVLTAMEK